MSATSWTQFNSNCPYFPSHAPVDANRLELLGGSWLPEEYFNVRELATARAWSFATLFDWLQTDPFMDKATNLLLGGPHVGQLRSSQKRQKTTGRIMEVVMRSSELAPEPPGTATPDARSDAPAAEQEPEEARRSTRARPLKTPKDTEATADIPPDEEEEQTNSSASTGDAWVDEPGQDSNDSDPAPESKGKGRKRGKKGPSGTARAAHRSPPKAAPRKRKASDGSKGASALSPGAGTSQPSAAKAPQSPCPRLIGLFRYLLPMPYAGFEALKRERVKTSLVCLIIIILTVFRNPPIAYIAALCEHISKCTQYKLMLTAFQKQSILREVASVYTSLLLAKVYPKFAEDYIPVVITVSECWHNHEDNTFDPVQRWKGFQHPLTPLAWTLSPGP
ncbi:hypothetical protein BDV93DRAFT_509860 [Ceratobasidium sp. AG-I]|nr:hypothetical protein BDV93DRAFT_509860 [Ceratobasidium sp. AG-I]